MLSRICTTAKSRLRVDIIVRSIDSIDRLDRFQGLLAVRLQTHGVTSLQLAGSRTTDTLDNGGRIKVNLTRFNFDHGKASYTHQQLGSGVYFVSAISANTIYIVYIGVYRPAYCISCLIFTADWWFTCVILV